MATTLRTVARSQLRTQRLRFALTKLGIALAAFFLCAVFILNVSVTESARQAVADIYGKADAVVQSSTSSAAYMGQGVPLSSAFQEAIETSPVVETVWPLSSTYDWLDPVDNPSDDADRLVLRYDLPADSTLFPYDLAEGTFPTEENQVLISSTRAEARGLTVGQQVRLSDYQQVTPEMMLTGEDYPTARYTVSGIFRLESNRAHMDNAVFTTGNQSASYNARTQALSGISDSGTAGTVLIKFKDPSTTLTEFATSLGDNTDDGYLLRTAQEQIEHDITSNTTGQKQLVYALLASAALALLMAGFVIANTLQILSQQRSRELALLRVLGAKRGGLTRMLLAEAALLGFGSGLAGVITAYLFSLFVQYTGGGFYVYISWQPAALALAVCTLVTVLCSLQPAIRAYRTSPLQALTHTDSVGEQTRSGLFITGVFLLTAAGIGSAFLGLTQAQAVTVLVATFVLALVCVLCLPWVLRPALRLVCSLSNPHSASGLGTAGALRARAQTASSGRMLFTCVALVSAVLTGYASVMLTSITESGRYNPFDIASAAQASYSDALRMETELEQAGQIRGAALGIVQGETTSLQDLAEPILYSVDPQRFASALPDSTSVELETGQVLISKQDADGAGLHAGDLVTAKGSRGTAELSVVITDISLPYLLIDRATGQELSGTDNYSVQNYAENRVLLFANLVTGLSEEEQSVVLANLGEIMGTDGTQFAGSLREAESIRFSMNRALTWALALLSVAMLISLVGIANTQMLSAYQRQRETALLRSLGMSRRALRAVMSAETLSIAVLPVSLGVLAGTALALLFLQIFVIEGVEIQYAFHWQGLLITWLAGIALAWLSGVIPAYRASRVPPVAALRQIT